MAAAVVAGGFLMAGEWEARVKILLLFRQMMVYLKSRILYSNETLPEALKEVGTRFADEKSGMEAEAGLFFLRVEKRMEEERGKSFSEIWKEELDRLPEDLPMRNEDLQALRSLGENLGYADKTTQERTILFYLEQADDSLAFLKKETESRTKLYRSLGMAAGLFILVLFAVHDDRDEDAGDVLQTDCIRAWKRLYHTGVPDDRRCDKVYPVDGCDVAACELRRKFHRLHIYHIPGHSGTLRLKTRRRRGGGTFK